jgi:integrase
VTLVPAELATVETADVVLSDAAQERLDRSVPANTRAAYTRQGARFLAWCRDGGRSALPATPQTLADYVSHLADLDLAPATIEQAVAAIRTAHRQAGYKGHPDTEGALRILKVYRRDRAQQGRRVRRARPVTLDAVRLMLAQCPDSLRGRRDAALLVLGYGLFGRRSELAALQVEQLTLSDGWVTVHVAMSKTDQSAHGSDVEIPRQLAPDIDAVRIVQQYLDALADQGVTAGPLLRSIDQWGRPGARLSGASVNAIVKRLAHDADLTGAERMTAHGLRAGGPTDAAERGVPVPFIAQHGRWSANSTQVFTYVRPADKRRNNPLLTR